jgi:hypothetical protein
VAQQVLNQGGSKAQAWVAAALVDGIESSGDPTAANPSSTACGLFQFLTTTWLSNGGGTYAPTACQANWEQQIQVFLNASAGNNFYPWAPDLGGSYNGNAKQPAATAPQPGSQVASRIAQLSAGGTMSFLGAVPTNWADAGAATPGGQPPAGGGAADPSSTGNCQPGCWTGSCLKCCIVQFPGFLFFSGPCLFTKGGVKWLSGVAALALGGGLLGFGVVLLAAWGFDASGAKEAVGKTTRAVGIPAALFAGQPEVAAGLKMSSVGRTTQQSRQSSSSRTQQTGRRPATNERVAGRRESRRIEDQYRSAVAQQGPIGPRGANAASRRAYERRTSYAGAGRPRTPEQRAAARRRASQPF